MPYELFKNDKGETCVRNKNTGENKGCSKSRKMGVAHMRALYAHEGKKEIEIEPLITKALDDFNAQNPDYVDGEEDLETKDYGETYPYSAYYGATSFDELDAIQEAQDQAMDINSLVNQYTGLLVNNVTSPMMDASEKVSSAEALSSEFLSRLKDTLNGSDETKEGDLYDSEEDGLVEKAKWSTAKKNDLPDSAFLYVEPGCKTKDCRHFPYKNASGAVDRAHLTNAIARIPQSNAPGLTPERKAALQNRARKMLANLKKEIDEESFIEKIVHRVKEAMSPKPEEPGDVMIYKEDSGGYAWIARYSNNFRDNDNPSEIISAASHKRFVDLVEKGLAPMPVLELWHIPEWRIGYATWVAYDDTGFAVAGGKIDHDKEAVAEELSKVKNIRVSHGMPPYTIKRDEGDPSIIIEHETREISALPGWAAANKLTGFIVLDTKQEDDMPIPANKRDALIKEWHLAPTLLDSLEAANLADASKAKTEGLESKEAQASTEESKPVETAAAEVPVTEKKEETATETTAQAEDGNKSETSQDYPTRQEVAEAFTSVVTPFVETTNAAITALAARLDEITNELKELKEADQTKIVKQAMGTPAASLMAMFAAQSAIKNPKAQVKENSDLGKSKPKETAPEAPAYSSIPFLNDMLAPKQK